MKRATTEGQCRIKKVRRETRMNKKKRRRRR